MCFDASQVTPEMHAAASANAPQRAAEAFDQYLRAELAVGQPLCLVIRDSTNAEDSMEAISPALVRDGMWPEITQAERDLFDQHCQQHANAQGTNGNAHLVFLDQRAKIFKTNVIPIVTLSNPTTNQRTPGASSTSVGPSSRRVQATRRERAPSPSSGRSCHGFQLPPPGSQEQEELVQTLAADDYVEQIIDMEYTRMHRQDPTMAIGYLRSVYSQADRLFGGPNSAATRRAKAFAKQKLQELGQWGDAPGETTDGTK